MSRARASRDRAATWASQDERVAAAVVYGSVAAGTEGPYSDLDLLIVARQADRKELWSERQLVAETVLGDRVGWAQELPWQRDFRYQAWDSSFAGMVDLTFDEGRPVIWRGLADSHEVLVNSGDLADWLATQLAAWSPPEFDAPAFDAGTWPWLAYLDNHLRRGNYWMVRSSLYDTLNTRIVPLLGAATDNAQRLLPPEDVAALHTAAPASGDPDELRRALLATAQLYNSALDRWSNGTDSPRPDHPMAQAVLYRLQSGSHE